MSEIPAVKDIEAALSAGAVERAIEASRAFVAAGGSHPLPLRLAALDHARRGEPVRALGLLERALALAPDDLLLLTLYGLCLGKAQRSREAVRALKAVLARQPDNATAQAALADNLAGLGDVAGAMAAYRRAIELDPHHADALARLATLTALSGDPAEARGLAERAIQAWPENPEAEVALALAQSRLGELAPARARLEALLAASRGDPVLRAGARGYLGDVLHAQGAAADAFRCWQAANAERQGLFASVAADAQDLEAMIVRLRSRFADGRASAPPRTTPPPAGPARSHVFLLGFPRSGTTLLEQALAAHPDAAVLDEAPTLLAAETEFLRRDDGLTALEALDDAALDPWRDRYWRVARAAGAAPQGKVFIDKMPMASLSLPLIQRLFPHARILLALRDPRDVVLSCFRQDFRPNGATWRMLTLEGAAQLYDDTMTLVAAYRQVLPLQLREVRYERLVEAFAAELAAICDFVGLTWTDDLLDFAQQARARVITTPSAAQVRKGLYRGGEGQWRSYRDPLQSVLPMLAPWVERFGYPTD